MQPLTEPRLQAVIYLRVSTKEQAERGGGEGYSIPAQREACLRQASLLNADVVDEFVDAGESAKTAARPQLQRLLGFLKTDRVQYVIVHKVDRLARSRADDVQINIAIRASGATLVSCTENIDDTPSGSLVHGIMSSIAEFYSKNLATEVIKGSVQKAKAGGTPSKVPTGYLNVRTWEDGKGKPTRTVEIDPDRGPLMAWAFEAYATGEWSLRTLLAELTNRGLTTLPSEKMPSKPLVLSNLNRLLRNPYYRGIVTYRGVQYAGNHLPLVSPEVWQRVQDVLTSANVAGDKHKVHAHYLTGSLFCGDRGERMIVSMATGRRGTLYPYFICVGRQKRRTECQQRAVLIETAEILVEDHYLTVQPSGAAAAQITEALSELLGMQRAQADGERLAQERRMRQLLDKRMKLLDAYYEGALPKDLMKTEQTRIAAEIDAAQSRLDALSVGFDKIDGNLRKAMSLASDWHAAYLAAAPAIRRQLNQGIFKKVFLHEDGRISSQLAEPFSTLLSAEVKHIAAVPKELRSAGGPEDWIDCAWRELSAVWAAHGVETTNPPDDDRREGLRVNVLVGAEGLEPPTDAL